MYPIPNTDATLRLKVRREEVSMKSIQPSQPPMGNIRTQRHLKGWLLVLAIPLLAGCASTKQSYSSPSALDSDPSASHISVSRSNKFMGGALTISVYDGDSFIGKLGPGGCLDWSRKAGLLDLKLDHIWEGPMGVKDWICPSEHKSYNLIVSSGHGKGRLTLKPGQPIAHSEPAYAATLIAGSATTIPLKPNPKLTPTVLVYPIMDARENKTIDLTKLGGENQKSHPLNAYYMRKNFNCITKFGSDIGIEPNVSYTDLAGGNYAELSQVDSGGCRYVLVIYLEKLGYGIGNTSAKVSLELFLIDSKTNTTRWSSKAKKTAWLGVVGGSLERITAIGTSSPEYLLYSRARDKALIDFPPFLEP